MTTVVYKNGILYTDTKFTNLLGDEETRHAIKALEENIHLPEVERFLNWNRLNRNTLEINMEEGKYELNHNQKIKINGHKVLGYTFAGAAQQVPEVIHGIENSIDFDDAMNKIWQENIANFYLHGGNAILQLAFITEEGCYVVKTKTAGELEAGWDLYFHSASNPKAFAFGSGATACLDLFDDNHLDNPELYVTEVDPIDFIKYASVVDSMTNDNIVVCNFNKLN